METRCLYYYTSPEAFFHRLDETAGTSAVRLRAVNLLYERPFDEIDFGLGLLREAIGRYERRHAIPAVNSKAQIPFFRNDRFKLVGPEEELYMLSLYEQPLAGGAKPGADTQPVVSPDLSGGGPGSRQESGCAALCLELDYGILAETCLFDTISLTRCEYDPEAFIASFLAELENGEYDRFGYDEEHSRFARSSKLIPFIFRACLQVKSNRFREEKEWRISVFKTAEEAGFFYACGRIIPYFDLDFPAEVLKSVWVYPPAGETSGTDRQKITGAIDRLLEKKHIPAVCRIGR